MAWVYSNTYIYIFEIPSVFWVKEPCRPGNNKIDKKRYTSIVARVTWGES